MSLPNVLQTVVPRVRSMSGLISQIKSLTPDPVSASLILPTCGAANEGIIEYTVMWGVNFRATDFIRFYAPNHLFFPTNYSLKGAGNSSLGLYFSKTWTVYGFNEGNKENPNEWEELGSHTSVDTSYCGSAPSCRSQDFDTFPLKRTRTGFKYIQWNANDITTNSRKEIATSGIELFGQFSKIGFVKPKVSCQTQNHKNQYLLFHLLELLFS